MAGLAAPWVVTTFTAKLRMLLAAAGSDSSVASLLLRDGGLQLAEIVGFTLMGVFLLAGTVAATISAEQFSRLEQRRREAFFRRLRSDVLAFMRQWR